MNSKDEEVLGDESIRRVIAMLTLLSALFLSPIADAAFFQQGDDKMLDLVMSAFRHLNDRN